MEDAFRGLFWGKNQPLPATSLEVYCLRGKRSRAVHQSEARFVVWNTAFISLPGSFFPRMLARARLGDVGIRRSALIWTFVSLEQPSNTRIFPLDSANRTTLFGLVGWR